ncbi:hypothetical protein AGMMS50267_08900 [Spirochaetia bacterium]|nr:hypothetical protein AGMMS50267_08900 [Spirochaetia bacterium]
MKLWYNTPAENWMRQALPIGNGNLGAMFFGGIEREHIQFNEKTVWTGSSAIRGSYQNFGDLYIDMAHGSSVTGYRRELSISSALGSVSYTVDGVSYLREYFASFPDKVIVMRFTTPGSRGRLSLTLDLAEAYTGGKKSGTANSISISGTFDLLSYDARLRVVHEGGSLSADAETHKVSVENADAVTVLLAGGTNFDIHSDTYIGETADALALRMQSAINAAAEKSYDDLKKTHLEDYRPLYNRVTLDLKAPDPDVPTDTLIRSHVNGNYIDMLYFQYGRYLMLASSRGMDLPNNLQGLWNNDDAPPWQSDIHSDINIQMNYWPAEVTNLSECHLPFLNYITTEALRGGGNWQSSAASLGNRGWTLGIETNIFAHDTKWETNRPANAWYCMHLWQHYAYTNDETFLRQTAYPVMKSACEFWLDRITLNNGTWEAPDEWSPEQQGLRQSGVPYAQQLIWDLFDKTIKAANVLNINDSFIVDLETKFTNLDNGLAVGDWGQIKEWKYDNSKDTAGNDHRHLSHLVALYPGDGLTVLNDARLTDAAKVSLNGRGDVGTGWARAWKIALWARLLDGDHARALLKAAMNLTTVTDVSMSNNDGGLYENLLDAHPPFQIDGNFGATAGIAEMLIQSHLGYINLLPALPSAWSSGSFTGLRAQGNFTIDLTWQNARPVRCTIYSGSGNDCIIHYPGMTEPKVIKTVPDGQYAVSF